MLFSRSLHTVVHGAISAGAIASLALFAGCAQQEQPGQASAGPNASTNSSAVTASDTSRSSEPAESHLTMAYPTGNRASSELLLEEIGPREVRVGQAYNYQIRVTNLTDQRLTGVQLQQRLPDTFRLANSPDAAADPNAAAQNAAAQNAAAQNAAAQPAAAQEQAGGQARINVGDLGPHESRTVQMSGTPTKAGTLDTCLSARYNPPTLCSVVNVVAPALRATVQGPSQADICQNLTYQYTITNTGTGTAHNVLLQEDLPQGLQTADGRNTFTANVGDLTQGQSKNVNATLRASQPGRFMTRAIARSSDAGQAETDQVNTAVLAPRLAVTVAGPKEDYLGQPLTYQVTVKNNGDAPAANTHVRLGATPGKVQFVSAQDAQGNRLAEEHEGEGQPMGTLAPGEARTFAVTFNPLQGGPLSLDATATAQCAQKVTTPVNTDIRTITASALVVTHDPDPVRVGNDVVYHVTVQNKGSAPDQNVKVTGTLPDSEQFVKVTGQNNATNNGNTIDFGTVPTLAPKQTVTWDVEARAIKAADDAQFRATMTSDSTKTPAVKIEPTKLYGGEPSNQQRTNEAPAPTQTEQSSPAPQNQTSTPAPAPDQANK